MMNKKKQIYNLMDSEQQYKNYVFKRDRNDFRKETLVLKNTLNEVKNVMNF